MGAKKNNLKTSKCAQVGLDRIWYAWKNEECDNWVWLLGKIPSFLVLCKQLLAQYSVTPADTGVRQPYSRLSWKCFNYLPETQNVYI